MDTVHQLVKFVRGNNILLLTALYFCAGASTFFELTDFSHFTLNQLELVILSLIACLSLGLKKDAHKSRSIVVSLMAYNVYVFATDWAFDYVSPIQWFSEIFAFCALTIYQIVRKYDYKSDVYNNKTVMLAFYRPKKMSESLTSLVGAPVSSMSIICNGNWYTYRRKCPDLCKEWACERNLSDYILIDTSVEITQDITKELDALVGTPARSWKTLYFRASCVATFKQFLNGLGGKWELEPFDTVSSIYMLRRLKNERDCKRHGY